MALDIGDEDYVNMEGSEVSDDSDWSDQGTARALRESDEPE